MLNSIERIRKTKKIFVSRRNGNRDENKHLLGLAINISDSSRLGSLLYVKYNS